MLCNLWPVDFFCSVKQQISYIAAVIIVMYQPGIPTLVKFFIVKTLSSWPKMQIGIFFFLVFMYLDVIFFPKKHLEFTIYLNIFIRNLTSWGGRVNKNVYGNVAKRKLGLKFWRNKKFLKFVFAWRGK
jgi:hypothetical protein